MKFPWSALNPEAKRGLLAHALQFQAVQIGSLYVSIYLFRLGQGFRLPAWHALWSYVAVPVGYWMAARISRWRGPASSMRLGLCAFAAFQLMILLLGPESACWAGPLGFLTGLGTGLYWQSWVLLMMDLTTEGRDRDAMLGSNQNVYFIASLTGAPLAGWYLTYAGLDGYPVVFGVGLALFTAAWLVSLPLKGKPQHRVSAVKRLVNARKPLGWTAMMVSAMIMGITSIGTMFLPLLLGYQSGGDEGHGGLCTALAALVGLTATALVARKVQPRYRGKVALRAALTVVALTLPLVLDRSFLLTLLFSVGTAVSISMFNVPMFAVHIGVVEAHPRFRYRRADAMFLRELPLNFGRILVCAVLVWGVPSLQSGVLSLLLVGLAFAPLMNYTVLRSSLKRTGQA